MIVPVATQPRGPARSAPSPAPAPAPPPAPAPTPTGPTLHLHIDALEVHGLGPLDPALLAAGLREALAQFPDPASHLLNPESRIPHPASLSLRLPAAPSSYTVGQRLAGVLMEALSATRPR